MNLQCEHYIGQWVWVVYYKDGWNVVNAKVLDDPYGIIVIDDDLDVGMPYWVGKQFYSLLKTLPLVAPGTLGKTVRTSNISVYVRSSRGGYVSIDGIPAALQYPVEGQVYSGKIDVVVGGTYTEDSQIEISTNDVWDLKILGIEVNTKRYEK